MGNNNSNVYRPVFTLDLPCRATSVEGAHGEAWDPLTGALTRLSLLAQLDLAKRAADRREAGFAVCLIDVDQLKNINDRHGQRIGDAVLSETTQRVRQTLSAPAWLGQHTIGRFDGDALMLLLKAYDLERAVGLGEELRMRIAARPLMPNVTVTVSIGVAQYRMGEPLDDTLARAERALHLAKQSGRDRVEAHPGPRQHEASDVLRFGPRAAPKRSP